MDAGKLWTQAGVPLLRIPDAIPRPLIAVGAMIVLAGLDVLGAVLARRWSHGGSAVFFAAGVACFALLFWVYGSSLRYADLLSVTFGWIVALQVGIMVIGRRGSAAAEPLGHWVAAVAIIGLEGYLLLTSSPS
jgi:apolipoprotein N-acyltransferase